MSRVDEVMNKLAAKFQPEAADDLNAVFQINIEDGEPYIIAVADQSCQVCAGEHSDPDVTLIMNSDIFVGIIEGDVSGTGAFFSGALRAEGDVMLATKLSKLFTR